LGPDGTIGHGRRFGLGSDEKAGFRHSTRETIKLLWSRTLV
jgi:hypothetical protein